MTRILQIVDADGGLPTDAALALDDELIDYFSQFADFPGFARLALYPDVGETRIEEPERQALAAELAPLAERVKARTLPEPPSWVGLEGGTDIRIGEELGWRGLLGFLQRLERLLFLAHRLRGELWVMEE